MDSVIDKEQRLSEGHSEAEDRKLDWGPPFRGHR